jgi:hypothetical protein
VRGAVEVAVGIEDEAGLGSLTVDAVFNSNTVPKARSLPSVLGPRALRFLEFGRVRNRGELSTAPRLETLCYPLVTA